MTRSSDSSRNQECESAVFQKIRQQKKNMEYPQNLHGQNDLGIWKKTMVRMISLNIHQHSRLQTSRREVTKNVPTTVIKNCQIYEQFG